MVIFSLRLLTPNLPYKMVTAQQPCSSFADTWLCSSFHLIKSRLAYISAKSCENIKAWLSPADRHLPSSRHPCQIGNNFPQLFQLVTVSIYRDRDTTRVHTHTHRHTRWRITFAELSERDGDVLVCHVKDVRDLDFQSRLLCRVTTRPWFLCPAVCLFFLSKNTQCIDQKWDSTILNIFSRSLHVFR